VNAEKVVSWLMHSERLLPILWVLLLAASSAWAFSDRSVSSSQRSQKGVQRR
jgi:hypothetical protein